MQVPLATGRRRSRASSPINSIAKPGRWSGGDCSPPYATGSKHMQPVGEQPGPILLVHASAGPAPTPPRSTRSGSCQACPTCRRTSLRRRRRFSGLPFPMFPLLDANTSRDIPEYGTQLEISPEWVNDAGRQPLSLQNIGRYLAENRLATAGRSCTQLATRSQTSGISAGQRPRTSVFPHSRGCSKTTAGTLSFVTVSPQVMYVAICESGGGYGI
jgi:hypothetical protein